MRGSIKCAPGLANKHFKIHSIVYVVLSKLESWHTNSLWLLWFGLECRLKVCKPWLSSCTGGTETQYHTIEYFPIPFPTIEQVSWAVQECIQPPPLPHYMFCVSLVSRPHLLTRRNGLVNQVKFLGLAHTFVTVSPSNVQNLNKLKKGMHGYLNGR